MCTTTHMQYLYICVFLHLYISAHYPVADYPLPLLLDLDRIRFTETQQVAYFKTTRLLCFHGLHLFCHPYFYTFTADTGLDLIYLYLMEAPSSTQQSHLSDSSKSTGKYGEGGKG